jgi:hypothetical protein
VNDLKFTTAGDYMNTERIRDLAREAGLLVHNPTGVPTKLDKFAQLIVRECADIADTAEPYKSSDLIKKHFGVEQ